MKKKVQNLTSLISQTETHLQIRFLSPPLLHFLYLSQNTHPVKNKIKIQLDYAASVVLRVSKAAGPVKQGG